MMIRKGVRLPLQAHPLKLPEETGRMTDARQRVQTSAAQRFRAAGTQRVMQIAQSISDKVHAEYLPSLGPFWNRCIAIQHQGMRFGNARRALAQWPGRQRPAIADATLVDYDNLDAPPQPRMLPPIVCNQHIAVRVSRQERLRRRNAIAANEDRTACTARQQQRFVANKCRIARGRHRMDTLRSATVAATDYAWPPASFGQFQHKI